MPDGNALLGTIGAIHAAGLDAELWPQTLASVARLLGSSAATLESYDPLSGRLLELHAFGIPPTEQLDYFEHYAVINPRATYALRQPTIDLVWDYQVLDETAMDRDPYYSEFLPRTDFRYFLSGNLFRNVGRNSIVSIQRTRSQGHVEAAEIALMQQLVPHFQQAIDVATRLNRASAASHSLEDALGWLADGVALVRADGTILYANDALQAIGRRKDGIGFQKGAFEFAAHETSARFAAALRIAIQLRSGSPVVGTTDVAVVRGAGMPPYLLSVRPLRRKARSNEPDERAVAMVFVRDPLSRNLAANEVLREIFGFTNAEADLARALQAGVSVSQYARERAVSLNTVYTHLRRLKEKTNCTRMGELIRRLNDLQVPLRRDQA
jgi:DNA-binding CsgD family transcriptional regulator